MLIEFERAAPIIVDRSLYRELVKQAIARTVDRAGGARSPSAPPSRQASRTGDRSSPRIRSPRRERDERRQLRELAEQAHGVNLDLGAGLLNGLATVDPADMNVARFFVYGLLGADYDELAVHADGRAGRAAGDVAGSGW